MKYLPYGVSDTWIGEAKRLEQRVRTLESAPRVGNAPAFGNDSALLSSVGVLTSSYQALGPNVEFEVMFGQYHVVLGASILLTAASETGSGFMSYRLRDVVTNLIVAAKLPDDVASLPDDGRAAHSLLTNDGAALAITSGGFTYSEGITALPPGRYRIEPMYRIGGGTGAVNIEDRWVYVFPR
jgi:hypothetical protein